jgi:hypothetical protein
MHRPTLTTDVVVLRPSGAGTGTSGSPGWMISIELGAF